jgi:hypothetical protein
MLWIKRSLKQSLCLYCHAVVNTVLCLCVCVQCCVCICVYRAVSVSVSVCPVLCLYLRVQSCVCVCVYSAVSVSLYTVLCLCLCVQCCVCVYSAVSDCSVLCSVHTNTNDWCVHYIWETTAHNKNILSSFARFHSEVAVSTHSQWHSYCDRWISLVTVNNIQYQFNAKEVLHYELPCAAMHLSK